MVGIGPGALLARQQQSRLEADVKATFLYHFSRYVDWPSAAPGSQKDSPFRVCVLAESAFERSVAAVLKDETLHGRRVIWSVPATPDAARSCQILYIDENESERVRFVTALRTLPVLTVSDAPDFLAEGGHIALVRDDKRIRFDISLPAATQSGLALRSQLLRVARKVIRTTGGHP